MSADKKVIWITGASSGIGYELTKQYASEGHRVYASARSRLDFTEAQDQQSVISIIDLRCDVTDRMSLQNAAKKIQAEAGFIDLLIINAGICE